MARNNSRRKTDKRKGAAKKIEPLKVPIKKISYLVVFAAAILGSVFFLRNSHYFKLDKIEIIDRNQAAKIDNSGLLSMYKGRNIFDIDIASLASRIKHNYPVIKEVAVNRVLPNKLRITVVPRMPVAKIKSYGYFPIDREGMVLSPEIKSHKLPVIEGFSMWLKPRPGQLLESRDLESAFFLIDALKESPVSANYGVSTIDISSPMNISFYLENGIEVKIGGENFPDRLKTLESTLKNPKLDKENIKYIDLRFKDIVIGPK